MFLLGHWKNFEELEENLSLPELQQILDSIRKKDFEERKFLAALKGVNLDDHKETQSDSFDAIKKRAEAKIRGIDVEQVEFEEVGVAFMEWEDE